METALDVLVVGGGCTGCGTALDAATRGLRVGLVERGDFGNETSSRSTKLIWAGIRYIATACSALLRWNNVTRPIDALGDFVGEFQMVLGPHLTNCT
jgi:glycerol-3-phosphate dehydrogenase